MRNPWLREEAAMDIALFAGIAVSDYVRALDWYERLVGAPASFAAHETESVWQLAENRSFYVLLAPEDAGHARLMWFVDDLDDFVARARSHGVEPESEETYGNGVRKTTYRDPDGNEVGIGGAPEG
jgi:catechol 2,3-dioxygenase-like lactoylglutathione lyase family enzyme